MTSKTDLLLVFFFSLILLEQFNVLYNYSVNKQLRRPSRFPNKKQYETITFFYDFYAISWLIQ